MHSIVVPKYHRQRFLLLFIEVAGGEITKIDLQKLLFLAHQEADFQYYDFVPYQYGCYSFQVTSDLDVLKKAGWIRVTDSTIILNERVSKYGSVKSSDKRKVKDFVSDRKGLRGEPLIKHVYERYPSFTRNSKIAHRYITPLPQIQKAGGDGRTLYTIGYEGKSIESYVNKLIENEVHLLCDVRRNPLSRKFGFSKRTMSKILPEVGIKYVHIPELGVVSSMRKGLETYSDYVELFKAYDEALPSKENFLKTIYRWIDQKKNVAITCFENDAAFCHRSHIGGYMEKKFQTKLIHL